MYYLFSTLLILLFLNGCTGTKSPQLQKEIQAKQVIESNKSEAEQAKNEYLALKAKRQKET